MRGSWLIPQRFREVNSVDSAEAGWLNRRVTAVLQSIARRACMHPIHTIVVIALLASTTYVGLLEGSLFDSVRDAGYGPGQLDVVALLEGGRNLRLGQQTSWRWQVDDNALLADREVCFARSRRIIGWFGSNILMNRSFSTWH
jgi:hydroxymethylglutaryl-CoA reductase (NADPH)